LLTQYDQVAYQNTPFYGVAYQSFADVMMSMIVAAWADIAGVPFARFYCTTEALGCDVQASC